MAGEISGIYPVRLDGGDGKKEPVYVFLIPGFLGEHSLMIDTGSRRMSHRQRLREELKRLGIEPSGLDILITHRHRNHCGQAGYFAGLGARIWMNPEENFSDSSCLSRDLSSLEPDPFPFEPIRNKMVFACGGFQFRPLALRGHTPGQTGLYDSRKKILFLADQLAEGGLPAIGSLCFDQHLLEDYLESLLKLKLEYGDYLGIPSHGGRIRNVGQTAEERVKSCTKWIWQTEKILKSNHRKMTVGEVCRILTKKEETSGRRREKAWLWQKLTLVFSCLEFLYDQGYIFRSQEEGVHYWGI